MNKPARSSDALERLRDERLQIEELFNSLDAHAASADGSPAERSRIASLIFTLLRVHAQLESELLHPALVREVGADPALVRAATARAVTLDAVSDAEVVAVRDPGHGAALTALRGAAMEWFAADEEGVFPLARRTLLDLHALDGAMGARQEALLTAGRER